MHRAELASRSQKHGVKDLLPGVLGIAAPLRQSLHPRGKIEHLVQIAFEPMPAREAYDFSFSFKNPTQIDLANGGGRRFKALAQLDSLAHLLDHALRDVEGLGLAVNQDGNLVLGMQAFAVGTVTVRSPTRAPSFYKGAGQHFPEQSETPDQPTA